MTTDNSQQDQGRPSAAAILKNPVHLLATGLGSGLSPKAPGTTGSLAAVLIYMALLAHIPLLWQIAIVIIATAIGVYICGKTAADWGAHDHGSIVWDEWAAQWLVLLGLPWNSWGIVAGFLFFRLFDIWKPWPISWFDKHVHGGLGIMADDLIAGLMAIAATQALLYWLA